MAQANRITITGPGWLDVLWVNFSILKLANLVDWSWFWVLSPLWIQIVLAFVIIFAIKPFIKERHVKRTSIRR